MSRSRYSLLINSFIDSLKKRDNFRVYLERAHQAFLTTLVVLVSYQLFFLVFLDLTKLNSRLQFTLMWQEQSLAAVTISTSRMLLRGFSSSCLFHVNINMRESSAEPRVQSSTWLDPKKLTTWNLHKWLQSKLNLTIRVVTKILQRV